MNPAIEKLKMPTFTTKSGHAVSVGIMLQRGVYIAQLRKDSKPAGLQITAKAEDVFKALALSVMREVVQAYVQKNGCMDNEELRDLKDELVKRMEEE